MASHEFLYEELSKTGIPVFSEESKHHSFDINKLQWIIDPIDGTLNFHRGFPNPFYYYKKIFNEK